MVYNHIAIYFHFTEFESCSINSTHGTDEAHCRALGTLCRTTAYKVDKNLFYKNACFLVLQVGTRRFSDNYAWFLKYRSVLPITCRYAAIA